MPLIYSLVARGLTVLCEFTSYSGNFSTVAVQCLSKVGQQRANKVTFNCDGHTFNFLQDEDYTYLVVADEAYGRNIPFKFLEIVKDDFSKTWGTKASTAAAYSLNTTYGKKLKEHMDYVEMNPAKFDKMSAVQKQVDEVKNVMIENIEKVLDRGEKIELLVDKTQSLRNSADTFHRQGKQLRRQMWLNNLKMKLLIFFIVAFVIFIIFLIACKGFQCTK